MLNRIIERHHCTGWWPSTVIVNYCIFMFECQNECPLTTTHSQISTGVTCIHISHEPSDCFMESLEEDYSNSIANSSWNYHRLALPLRHRYIYSAESIRPRGSRVKWSETRDRHDVCYRACPDGSYPCMDTYGDGVCTWLPSRINGLITGWQTVLICA